MSKNDSPFDKDLDNSYFKNELKSMIVSLFALLALLAFAVQFANFDYPQQDDVFEPYVLSGLVKSLDKIDGQYFMLIEVIHDGVKTEHQIELTKEQFVKYRVNDIIQVKITQHEWLIYDENNDV